MGKAMQGRDQEGDEGSDLKQVVREVLTENVIE